nr:hypothetical protein [Pseudomonas mosselii]
MNMNDLISQIEENINYQIDKLSFLWTARNKTNDQFLREASHKVKHDAENAVVNQALTDGLMNSMASLVDYYYIYCFIKLGIKSEWITKVQYRPLNNKFLISTTSQKEPGSNSSSVAFIKKKFDERIASLNESSTDKININDYWAAFFGDAISNILFDAKLLPTKKFELEYMEGELKINNLVHKYNCYMQKFYCNEHFSNGVKYNIYIDINNCLKHNIVPYVTPKFEIFEGEKRGFSYFEFKQSSSVFLKPGLLRDIVELDFDLLHKNIEQMYTSEVSTRSSLEISWEMCEILKVDKGSDYISSDGKTLYFFVDGILMAKTNEATYIDAGISLKRALGRLIEDIKYGMNLDLSQFE